jgi:hypothetical protein
VTLPSSPFYLGLSTFRHQCRIPKTVSPVQRGPT